MRRILSTRKIEKYRYGLLAFCLLFIIQFDPELQAQIVRKESAEYQLRTAISLQNDSWSEPVISLSPETSSISPKGNADNLSTLFVNGEIRLSFPLENLDQEDEFYRLSFLAFLNGNQINIPPEFIKGPANRDLRIEDDQDITLTWIGLIDHFSPLEGDLEIYINIDRFGECTFSWGAKCSSPRPEFNLANQRGHYYVGLGGALMIGVGALLEKSSNDIYNNQYLTATTNDDRTKDYYNKANNRHKQARVLTYGGAGIILADIVHYLIKNRRFKNRQKEYDNYHLGSGELGHRPSIKVRSFADTDHFGLSLTFTF